MEKKKLLSRFTPEEKRRSRKYRLLLYVFVILDIVLFINYDSLAAFFVESFSKTEYFYIYLDFSVPFVLFAIFFLLKFIFTEMLFDKLSKEASYFSDFIAQKKHKNLIICIFVAFFCLLLSFATLTQCSIVADNNSYRQCHLFTKDEVLFDYNSVDSVRVYVGEEYYARIPTVHHVHVDVSVGDETYTLYSSGFKRNCKKVLDFLDNFEKEKITTDDTNIEEIITKNEEEQRLLKQIFNEYS